MSTPAGVLASLKWACAKRVAARRQCLDAAAPHGVGGSITDARVDAAGEQGSLVITRLRPLRCVATCTAQTVSRRSREIGPCAASCSTQAPPTVPPTVPSKRHQQFYQPCHRLPPNATTPPAPPTAPPTAAIQLRDGGWFLPLGRQLCSVLLLRRENSPQCQGRVACPSQLEDDASRI